MTKKKHLIIYHHYAYLIFVIFSQHMQIIGKFFLHTKARNSWQKRFATKVRKLRQNQFYNKNMNFTHVETFPTSHTCQMWRTFRFFHIFHSAKFVITPHVEKFHISPHLSRQDIWNFSTWQIFSPQTCWWRWRQISGMSQTL